MTAFDVAGTVATVAGFVVLLAAIVIDGGAAKRIREHADMADAERFSADLHAAGLVPGTFAAAYGLHTQTAGPSAHEAGEQRARSFSRSDTRPA